MEQQQAKGGVPETLPVPVELIRFLRGEAPLDGLWFGETRGKSYWWRERLPKPPEPVDPLREVLDDCWHMMTGPRGKAIDTLTAELRARGVTVKGAGE